MGKTACELIFWLGSPANILAHEPDQSSLILTLKQNRAQEAPVHLQEQRKLPKARTVRSG